jgi:hypothetical protein
MAVVDSSRIPAGNELESRPGAFIMGKPFLCIANEGLPKKQINSVTLTDLAYLMMHASIYFVACGF